MTGAVSFYDVVLWVHVTAVVVGFGGTFVYGVLLTVATRSAPRSLPGVLAGIRANDRSLVTVGGVVVFVTGIYLALDRWELSEFFISWGFLAVIVLLGLVHAFFLPTEGRALKAAERDIEAAGEGGVDLGEEFARANRKLAIMGAVAGLIIVLTVYVMVAKPFL
ncbi:MAG TPA: DUF2269 family protein [Thermoleophilaceae bacterium]|nr:DUF2269 family protein [Thermoleophilaceae bacterium]